MIIINKQIGSPKNPALLGLNVGGGVHVKLRLRRPNRDWDFFPFDQVLDTMLHELCHNAHGPHNASFYKLWDELRKVFLILLHFITTIIQCFISYKRIKKNESEMHFMRLKKPNIFLVCIHSP